MSKTISARLEQCYKKALTVNLVNSAAKSINIKAILDFEKIINEAQPKNDAEKQAKAVVLFHYFENSEGYIEYLQKSGLHHMILWTHPKEIVRLFKLRCVLRLKFDNETSQYSAFHYADFNYADHVKYLKETEDLNTDEYKAVMSRQIYHRTPHVVRHDSIHTSRPYTHGGRGGRGRGSHNAQGGHTGSHAGSRNTQSRHTRSRSLGARAVRGGVSLVQTEIMDSESPTEATPSSSATEVKRVTIDESQNVDFTVINKSASILTEKSNAITKDSPDDDDEYAKELSDILAKARAPQKSSSSEPASSAATSSAATSTLSNTQATSESTDSKASESPATTSAAEKSEPKAKAKPAPKKSKKDESSESESSDSEADAPSTELNKKKSGSSGGSSKKSGTKGKWSWIRRWASTDNQIAKPVWLICRTAHDNARDDTHGVWQHMHNMWY